MAIVETKELLAINKCTFLLSVFFFFKFSFVPNTPFPLAIQFNKALEHGGTPATSGLVRQQLMMSTKSTKSPEHQPNPSNLAQSNSSRRKDTATTDG